MIERDALVRTQGLIPDDVRRIRISAASQINADLPDDRVRINVRIIVRFRGDEIADTEPIVDARRKIAHRLAQPGVKSLGEINLLRTIRIALLVVHPTIIRRVRAAKNHRLPAVRDDAVLCVVGVGTHRTIGHEVPGIQRTRAFVEHYWVSGIGRHRGRIK